MNQLKLGFLLALSACFLYSVVSCFSFSLEDRYSAAQILFIQEGVALLALFLLSSVRKTPLKTTQLPLHLIRDLAALAAGFFWLKSLKSLHLVNASILQFTSPFYVPFIAWAWYKEAIPRNIWWGISLGFLGTFVILRPDSELMKTGAIWGILAGITSAIGLTAVRRLNLKEEPVERTMFYLFLTSALVAFPFAINQWVTPTWADLGSFALLGISTFLNNILLTKAFKYAPASYIAPLSYSAILFNGFFGWIFFNKEIHFHTVLGCLLIFIGGSFVYLQKEKQMQLLKD